MTDILVAKIASRLIIYMAWALLLCSFFSRKLNNSQLEVMKWVIHISRKMLGNDWGCELFVWCNFIPH